MARKSKRMVLNDAIRQGQARIQEGLKSGRMRSDNPYAYSSANKAKEDPKKPESLWQPPPKGVGVLSKSKKVLLGFFESGRKFKLSVVVFLVILAVLILDAWVENSSQSLPGNTDTGDQIISEQSTEMMNQDADSESTSSFSLFGKDDKKSADVSDKDEDPAKIVSSSMVASEGNNVIWIQSIEPVRRGELIPVKDFFAGKGIATEIIIIEDGSSAKAVLVTKQRFKNNPGSPGTEGHELFRRIKQLGPVYVQETNDKKFGMKPFQDVLGYKR